MTPEELKKLQEATDKAMSDSLIKTEAKIASETDVKIASQKKEIDELKIKLVELEKAISKGRGFNIVGKYPKKFTFMGKDYNIESQGEKLNEVVEYSPLKAMFKTFGKDNESYYNFKKWALVTYLASAFKSNHELQKAYRDFMVEHRKADEMVEGTVGLGGYAVAPQYESEFILLARNASFALNECTVMNISTNNIKFPKELTGTTVYYPGEATAPTESNFTTGQLSINVLKAMILTEGVSNELINDAVYDIVGYLTNDMGYAMGQNYDNQVMNGTAATWTSAVGLLTSAITNAVTLSGTSFADMKAEDFSKALVTLSDEAESKAKWAMNKYLLHYVRTLQDVTGRFVLQENNMLPGSPSNLWQAPIIKTSKATSTDGAGTAFAVCGDFKQYLIVRNPGMMSVESDPYTDFAKDMVRFRLVDRHGLGIKRAGDFCKVVTKA